MIVWYSYCGVIGALFIVLKCINARLHNIFDTSEVFEETASENEDSSDKNDDDDSSKTDTAAPKGAAHG